MEAGIAGIILTCYPLPFQIKAPQQYTIPDLPSATSYYNEFFERLRIYQDLIHSHVIRGHQFDAFGNCVNWAAQFVIMDYNNEKIMHFIEQINNFLATTSEMQAQMTWEQKQFVTVDPDLGGITPQRIEQQQSRDIPQGRLKAWSRAAEDDTVIQRILRR